MAASRILWHFAQLLPIVTAGAWAIACIVTLFTVPTEPPQRPSLGSSSSSPTSPTFFPDRRALSSSSSTSFGDFGSSSSFSDSYNSASAEYRWRRDYMFTLWIGTALVSCLSQKHSISMSFNLCEIFRLRTVQELSLTAICIICRASSSWL